MPLVEDVFLSRVGHDLRGELATMVAGVHYLLRYEAGLTDSAKQMLERVNGAGQRMKRLLDEFDNAAWIAGGDASQLAKAPCRADDLVASVVERVAAQAALRSARVEVEVSASLPAFPADAEVLATALEYVVDFCVSRSAGGRVRIQASDGQGVELRVEDCGGPVDEERLARLFEPFVEKDLAPRTTTGGAKRRERLGLGLAIARGMLVALGGAMRAEQGGEGLVFVCAMPR